MRTCDALIIGGGPAGSTCARELRNDGFDVLVLDKASFPREKVCAGWITPAVLELLQIDVGIYGRGHTLQPIRGFRTGLMDGQFVNTRYDDAVSFGIRRIEFDHYLLQRAGARLELGQPVTSLEKRDGNWIVNETITTPLLIGAGGHFCPVARYLGAKLGASELAVAAKEIEFEMNEKQLAACRVQPDTPELYFTPDLKGYGWCFRKGRYLNIGLGREDPHHLTEHLASFCGFLKHSARIPLSIPDKFHGHAYLLYGHAPRRMIDDGVLLIGDAAGLAHPESGEGIRPAIESAMLAANTIVEAKGSYGARQLAAYTGRLQTRFGAAAGADTAMPEVMRRLFAGVMLRNAWLTRHLLLDRWFLRRTQPAL